MGNFLNPAFCLDCNENFVISDVETGGINFFTKEGVLFQKLGKLGQDPGMFDAITGLTLTSNHKLVVVSMLGDFIIQIFSCF